MGLRTMRGSKLTAVACAGLIVSSLGAAEASAGTKRAKVVRVLDGDSVRVKVGSRARTYGLLGIEAPARRDCFGRQARSRLRKLLPRRARVRVVTDRRGGRRMAYIYRGRRLVNALMLSSGHAEADRTGRLRLGARLDAAQERAQARERGMWRACGDEPAPAAPPAGGAPATPPPGSAPAPPPPGSAPAPPPAGEKQQTIAEMDRLLQGVSVYTTTTSNGTTDEKTAHLCPTHRFLFFSSTLIVDSTGSFRSGSESAGTWKVVDAFVDPSTGVRRALVETVADQGDAAGETTRTLLQANADGVSGRWDDQPARFSRSDRC